MRKAARPTVADLLELRGQRQLTMLRVETLEEAEAAEKAGVDMLSIPFTILTPAFRDAAPNAFAIPGADLGELVTGEDYLRAGVRMMAQGGDAIYCAASFDTIRLLRDNGVPVCGHVGLIPDIATWTGGFRAVGTTAASALEVFRRVRRLEQAGAFAAEIEVVPPTVAAAIAERTSLFLISMGAGTACHAQYLFAEDVLGSHARHYPRHARVYRDFRGERIAAFAEFVADVGSGAYPEPGHLVPDDPAELAAFLDLVEREPR